MAHFLDNVREVREEIMRTPGAHLVFVSITVSPENHENNKAKFLEVDTAVKNLFSPTLLFRSMGFQSTAQASQARLVSKKS